MVKTQEFLYSFDLYYGDEIYDENKDYSLFELEGIYDVISALYVQVVDDFEVDRALTREYDDIENFPRPSKRSRKRKRRLF